MESRELDVVGYNLWEVMHSSDVMALSHLANLAADQGSKLSSLAYMAAYRIFTIYAKVEEVSNAALMRHLQMAKSIVVEPKMGSTGLRRLYNETFHGWPSFDAWVTDWASGAPVSRSSAWMKVMDIKSWREEGCGWPTVLELLSKVPMAAREAIEKPVKVEALPPAPDTGEPSKAEYLKELAALPPGHARKKVSEDAGEPQIYCAAASFEWTQQFGRALLLTIRLETSSEVTDYDLVVHPPESEWGEAWGAIALWLSDKLGERIKIG